MRFRNSNAALFWNGLAFHLQILHIKVCAGQESCIFKHIISWICGILHKAIYSFDNVIYLYIINFLMVATDMGLFLRNRKLEQEKVEA